MAAHIGGGRAAGGGYDRDDRGGNGVLNLNAEKESKDGNNDNATADTNQRAEQSRQIGGARNNEGEEQRRHEHRKWNLSTIP